MVGCGPSVSGAVLHQRSLATCDHGRGEMRQPVPRVEVGGIVAFDGHVEGKVTAKNEGVDLWLFWVVSHPLAKECRCS